MNVVDAAHKTASRYPGGAEALATRMGMTGALLRAKVNPKNDRNYLYIEEADEMMALSGDFLMLQALAATHGFGLVQLHVPRDNGSLLSAVLNVGAAEGEFESVLHDAMADGRITPNEMAALDTADAKHQAAIMGLMARLHQSAEPTVAQRA